MDPTRTLRILLIGDSEDDYATIRSLLAESTPQGSTLDWQRSLESGLAALKDPGYDACLLDCAPAGRTGLALLSEAVNKDIRAGMILLVPDKSTGAGLEKIAADYLVRDELSAKTLGRSIWYAVQRKGAETELASCREHLAELVKRREEQLRDIKRNTFLRTVLASLPHPFYVVDAKDYSVLLSNNSALPEELPHKVKCYSMFHGSDEPCSGAEHVCPLREIRKTGKPMIAEHIHYDGNGRARHVEVHAYPILDETGEVAQIIEYCLDISDRKEIEAKLRKAHDEMEIRVGERTGELANANLSLMVEIAERKQAEEALRLNERRLEALLNLNQVQWTSDREIARYVLEQELKLTRSETGAIGFLDEEEKIIKWCAGVSTRESTAYTRTEEAGTWGDAIRNHQPVVVNEIPDLEAAGRGLPFSPPPFRRFMSIPVCDGERTAAVAIVADKGGSYDQSDLMQLTLLMEGMWKLVERERSMKALKDAENLAAIGRALSSVAHDMKTPLVAIGGFAKQVQRHLDPHDPCRVKTEIILKETERLEKMVEDMLDFSKPVELRKSFEQIGPLLAESVEVTKPLADAKDIELRIEATDPADGLQLDPMRIKRVLINLLTNAIEASPEGQPVRIVHRRLGKDLVVDVSDNGPGIPCEIRKDIFLPFFTTRKGGTGLGLPIVKKLIEAHNGGVEVLNTPCGTTFRLRLPAG